MGLVHSTSFIGGVEVRPGATFHVRTQSTRFDIRGRCESVQPDRFSAAICVNGQELWRSTEFDSLDSAEAAAEAHFADRLRTIFAS